MSIARKVLLGRPSNNLTSGIVGLANVGKSTFFQAITNSKLGNPANYPFATIKPEEAKVQIPSRRLAHLKRLYQSEKCVPASLTMYDIAGLVRGASSGEGLGSTFLNDIRHVDGIYQVVRGFRKEDITHIEGSVDPVRDLSVVQDELILKDVEFLENIKERLQRKMGRTAKTSAEYREMTSELELMETLEEHLYEGRKIVHFKEDWSPEEVAILNKHNFLTAKPSLTLLNISAQDYISQRNEFVGPVKQWLDAYSPGDDIILFSAEFETVYNEFKDKAEVEDFEQYCKDTWGVPNDQMVLVESALPAILLKMRELLHLISFFTCGPLESRQWTVREGTTAPEAAGVIHTDLQNTFINASVTKYTDLAALEPPLHESVLKAQGKIKRAGKLYEIEDGDIVLFKAAGGKTR
ncbi:YLF2 (YHL014C) [Zygosaccharomyces parabailii]|nr:YLF2 (YHL014C) [Zygosaccharomyces parabailii]